MSKPPYPFSADVGFRDAARGALLSGLRKMMGHAAATRAGLEVETPTTEGIDALHDMRVGSRRLRAALSVFAKVFPTDEYRSIERQVKAITDALGAVRDLDVQLDYLRSLSGSLAPNEAYGIDRLISRQIRIRNKRRRDLIDAFDQLERERFERRFLRALDRAVPASTIDLEPETGDDAVTEEPITPAPIELPAPEKTARKKGRGSSGRGSRNGSSERNGTGEEGGAHG